MPGYVTTSGSKTVFTDINYRKNKYFNTEYMQSKETGGKYTKMPTVVLSDSKSVGDFHLLLYTFCVYIFV